MRPEPWFASAHGKPSPELRGFVIAYSGFLESHPQPIARFALPTPRVKLNVSFGSVLRVISCERVSSFESFVALPSDQMVRLEHDGFRHRINAILTPLGACRLLGVPLGALPPYVAADDVLGVFARELADRLASVASWGERFAIFDRMLRDRLSAPTNFDRDTGARALTRLEQTGGTLTISEIAGELGCTRKHVHERVTALAGICPKAYASLLRFQRVVHAMRSSSPTSLAEVARVAGFYDSSHLHRDVRRFAGTSPRDLWRDLAEPVARQFVEPI